MENHGSGPGDKQKRKKPDAGNGIPEQERNEPAAAERTSSGASEAHDDAGPSREEVVSNAVDPVTNQDEQDKITNAGANDVPVPDK